MAHNKNEEFPTVA